jgi:hypothetical protein
LQTSTIFGHKKKTTLGLATRTRAGGRLREHVGSEGEQTKKQKLIVDLTGDRTGPPQFPGCGPVCSWGPPRPGGITYRTAPPDFDIRKDMGPAADNPPPPPGFMEHVRRMNKGKEKSTTTVKDKGKKKMWEA